MKKKFLLILLSLMMMFSMLFIIAPSVALAADSGWRDAASYNDNNDVKNPQKAYGSGSAEFDTHTDTVDYTFGNNFIPPGSTITGIEVQILAERDWNLFGIDRPFDISLVVNGSPIGTRRVGLTSDWATYTLGSTSDTWGYSSWTSDKINTGFEVRVATTDHSAVTSYLDSIKLRVTYIAPPASTSTSVTSSRSSSIYGQAVTFTANVSPSAAAGTVQFYIDSAPFGSAVTLSGGSATSAAISTLAVGNHAVSATYSGNSGYATSSGSLSGGQTVSKAPLTVTAGNVLVTYGGTPAYTASYSGFVNGENASILGGTLAFDCSYVVGSPVSSYTITPKGLTSNNYAITFSNGTLTVGKKALTVKAEDKSTVYGSAAPANMATYSGFAAGDDPSDLGGSLAFDCSYVIGNPANTYTITPKGLTSNNYTIAFENGTLTVSKKALTVKAEDKSITYGNAAPAFTASYNGFISGDDPSKLGGTLSFDCSYSLGNPVNTYTITPKGLTSGNYSITFANGTLTVGKKALTVKAEDKSTTYGSAAPAFAASYNGFVMGDDSSDLGGALSFTCSYAVGDPVNTYSITPKGLTSTNYAIEFANGTLTVGKKAATITATASGKTYGQSDPTLGATVVGEIGGEHLVYNITRTPGENVGDYNITVVFDPGNAVNKNYAITTAGAKFAIAKKAATITATASGKIYGQGDPALGAVVIGEVNGEHLVYGVNRIAGENVGDYDIAVTFDPDNAVNKNYAITTVGAKFTIEKQAATITATASGKIYGQGDPVLGAVVIGEVNGEHLVYGVSRVAGENVGDYNITVTFDANNAVNKNYAITTTGAKFTIAKQAATITATASGKTYGQGDPALGAVVTGEVNGEHLVYGVNRIAGENVGDYDIAVTFDSDNAINKNYAITTAGAKFTITKQAATITATASGKIYGQGDPALGAVVTGEVNGEHLVYGVSRAAGENVGDYDIAVTFDSDNAINKNYAITTAGAKFTIAKQAATITATASGKTYGHDDPALGATVTGEVNGEHLVYGVNRIAGENVGDYDIAVTFDADNAVNKNYVITTAGAKFTIAKQAATITATASGKIYGQGDPALGAVVTGEVNGEHLVYGVNRVAGENVGDYDITVTFDPDNAVNKNYAITTVGAKFTITKAAVTIGANDKSKVYGQSEPGYDATVTGAQFDDVLDYSVGRANKSENVGSYDITVTLGNGEVNGNYNIALEKGTLTIEKADATIKANDKSKVYGQSEPGYDATVTGVQFDDELDYSVGRANKSEIVGSYDITVTLGNGEVNDNYNIVLEKGSLTIEKANVTIKANDKSKVYGQGEPGYDATVSGAQFDDELDYSVGRANKGENVGSYDITVTLGNGEVNGNYNIALEKGTLTIEKANVTIKANDKSKVYGQSEPGYDATVTGAQFDDELDYSVGRANKSENVGSYDITVTLGNGEVNDNYNIALEKGSLTIEKADATIKANDKSKVYGQGEPVYDATVTGAQFDDVLDYSVGRANKSENVGSYDITVMLGNGEVNGNYSIALEKGTLTIDQKALTITADNKTATYGDAVPSYTVSYDGFIPGESESVLGGTVAFDCSYAKGSPVNTYTIMPKGLTSNNYAITFKQGTLTVGVKAATIAIDSKSKFYGASDPALTAVVTGTFGQDALVYTLHRATGENVGTYVITATLGSNANYEIVVTDGVLTVAKKTAIITVANKSKIYGDADPAFTATVSGTVNDEALEYTLTRVAGENAGSYAIKAVLPLNSIVNANYDITGTDGALAIAQRAASISIDDKTKTAGNADPAFTAIVSGTVNGDVLTYSLTREAGEAVGTYEIGALIDSANDVNKNYDIAVYNGTLTIRRAATPTATPTATITPAPSVTPGSTPSTTILPEPSVPASGSPSSTSFLPILLGGAALLTLLLLIFLLAKKRKEQED